MKIVNSIVELQLLTHVYKKNNEAIVFIPTMGNLHTGHLALIKQSQDMAERVIVSIFINPLQFAPGEDFLTYPRTESEDIQQLAQLKVDAIFIPTVAEIYPNGIELSTKVTVSSLSDELCGQSRPGHFTGVATIVAKLFNIVQPDVAVFGQKDYQQLLIIQQMVQDLNFSVRVYSCPTVREVDGLAMSSRNNYLNAAERKIAPKLFQALSNIRKEILSGETNYELLCLDATEKLQQANFKVDYMSVRCQNSLKPPSSEDKDLLVLGAAYLGKTRLIDNVII